MNDSVAEIPKGYVFYFCRAFGVSTLTKLLIIALVFSIPFGRIAAQQYTEIVPANMGITHESSKNRIMTPGVAFCDINNDYLEDLVFGTDKDIKLYLNQGQGQFKDISGTAQFTSSQGALRGVFTGDINNDGFPDIIADGVNTATLLYLNNGNETFTDLTYSSGINMYNGVYDDNVKVSSIAFGDVNHDGYLDIYISTWANEVEVGNYGSNGLPTAYVHTGDKDRLYINNGDLTFTEMSAAYGLVNNDGCGLSGIFSDYDNDGDVDILLANDFGRWDESDKLFRNNYPAASFTDVSASSGYDTVLEGMGTGVGDYDKDGDLDYYKTSFGQKVLMNNNGGVFTDVAISAGVDDTYASVNPNIVRTGWGAGFTDCNNDGELDLIVANGLIGSQIANFVPGIDGVESYQPSLLFFNNGNGTFNEVSAQEGIIDTLFSRGFGYGDIDNDGFQDLIFTRVGRTPNYITVVPDSRPAIFSNNGNGNNWLKVKLQGVVNNRDAIGAHITIHSSVGSWVHEINSGAQGQGSQHSRIAHFGLGNASKVDSIVVQWPGSSSPDQVFIDIGINQFIHIKELDSKYNVVTCYNSTKDGKERGVDCGGDICRKCDCKSDILILSNTIINYNVDQIDHYRKYIKYEDGVTLNPNQGNSAFYAAEYILKEEGEINVPSSNASILLDIDDCLIKDLSYFLTLSDDFDFDHFKDYSIARIWMEVLLESIRNDFARPTIHARNLFHASSTMYDIWQIYNSANNVNGTTYLVDQTLNGFTCPMNYSALNLQATDVDEAICYAMARFLRHRFNNSPSLSVTNQNILGLFQHYGYDINYTGTNYATGNPADVGNYIAQCIIDYGLQDGANEAGDYANQYYTPVNAPLVTDIPGNPNLTDPDRWQPLTLETFIDQSGNLIPINTPDFLSPEWGNVRPFSMSGTHLDTYIRNGNTYNVYHDPGPPPLMDPANNIPMTDEYVWGFMMVSIWGSHLDQNDNTTIDISPAAVGNNNTPWPSSYYGLPSYYNYFGGSDYGIGHSANPTTGQPYITQNVKRGDYARVLAEFWADGPDSETPPGHWFTILNYVSDHPQFVKQFEGAGPIVGDLEWDIKSYFTLGGTMHDAAIAAWSVKGYYDYLRPISAIRWMGDQGQRSSPSLPNYSVNGLPIIAGYSQLVTAGDPLAGLGGVHVNKMKLYTWKGPDYINNPLTDEAGVGWILAEDWFPYQRPSFVTPPFAGYVSGHSTFSRAAAEVMTLLTGDAFFPGGMGEFIAPKDNFLVFEKGPSADVILQWATYRDASDQCSLSRIWGGIHPPADDIPGRDMGERIGVKAFSIAKNITGL